MSRLNWDNVLFLAVVAILFMWVFSPDGEKPDGEMTTYGHCADMAAGHTIEFLENDGWKWICHDENEAEPYPRLVLSGQMGENNASLFLLKEGKYPEDPDEFFGDKSDHIEVSHFFRDNTRFCQLEVYVVIPPLKDEYKLEINYERNGDPCFFNAPTISSNVGYALSVLYYDIGIFISRELG